jgi:beta-glucosidase
MKSVQSLIDQMTLEEKAALCTGASAWTTTPIERLSIPEMLVSDGPHGVRRVPDIHAMGAKSLPATCFPTASSLASTWNVNLIHEMGEALGEECISLNVDVLLGPGVNMKRTPLCGRNFEYFSEDPYLAGELAASLISGVQSKGVGTSLKHFAVNNQESERFMINAKVDERALREIYLPAFETAVRKGKPWTVMCAYNKLNGTYCSQHHELLTDILKDEWKFEGLIVSDWGAVHDRVAALRAGLDWQMPGPRERDVQMVVDAVRNGELDESVLNESVRRILQTVFKAAETPKKGTFDSEAHHALARRVASESIVLLKNNGILPLKDPQHIAVIGRTAEQAHFQGGGSSHINPTRVDVPYKELQSRAPKVELTYAEGYPVDNTSQPALIEQAVQVAQGADVAVLYIGLPAYKESEGYDRPDLDLTEQQVALIKAVAKAQPKTVVVLNNGAPVDMRAWLDDVAAVLEAWMMGQAGGGSIADVLLGITNPSGKLAETFPLKLQDTPAHINFPGGNGEVNYGEGLFIGYRYYDYKDIDVLFPFGYGLSYTSFEYSKPKVSSRKFKDTDGLTVSVDVKNTGQVAGKEIVQIYVRDVKSKLVRPLKELKGFAKVDLKPGEKKTATVKLDFRSFAYYHAGHKTWITESGEFEILIGASSRDIRCRETVELESTQNLPSILNRESTIRAWLEDPHGGPIFQPVYEQILAGMAAMFGAEKEESADIGMDMTGFLMEMPLLSIFQFQENNLPSPAVDMVDSLLKMVHDAEAPEKR